MKKLMLLDHRGFLMPACDLSQLPPSVSPRVRQVIKSAWTLTLIDKLYILVTAWEWPSGGPIPPVAAAQVVDTCLSEGFCPTCGYDIRDLQAMTDGCVVCPECDAAWRKR